MTEEDDPDLPPFEQLCPRNQMRILAERHRRYVILVGLAFRKS